MGLVVAGRVLDLPCWGDSAKSQRGGAGGEKTHVEVNVEVATATKLSVAHLECDSHLVIAMQLFVEAFA
jgi:hypothetical protein